VVFLAVFEETKMAKITGTFDNFWSSIEAKARELGAVDGDLPQIRIAVKNVLVTAGWADVSGIVNFLSETDKASALSAATAEVQRLSPALTQARKLTFTAGFQPTKGSLSASASASPVLEMSNVESVSSSFSPQMAKVGDACPRCSGSMQPVGLVNDRSALYCPKDRVVMPLPTGVSLR
jgi:hypothetical protein